MNKVNGILTLSLGTALILSSCSASKTAMNGGELDDMYFMASDAKVATEFAVANNNPQNFQSLNQAAPSTFEQENFSARNVNPEYIAKYQAQSQTQDSGTVYFDDTQAQETTPNVNVYNNFYGSSVNPNGWNGGSNVNVSLGFGMGWGMPMWGMPMGMWDPFWGWGNPWMMRPGFGWGIGWNSMWGWNVGMGWGMGGMWGMPGMGWGMGGMWGMRLGLGRSRLGYTWLGR
jgi:hypothetical protein